MQNLNSLLPPNSGWLLLSASAINNNGQITGHGIIHAQTHAFLLTPQ
jgi:probable HAF family extracellular repeat protein